MPERNKCSTYKKMTSALLPLSISFFIRLEITSERKKESGVDISISTRYPAILLSSISNVNTENNFKWTHLSARN